MYGELDDLLNEVEGALADTPPASKAPKPARAPRSNAGTARATPVGASSSKYVAPVWASGRVLVNTCGHV